MGYSYNMGCNTNYCESEKSGNYNGSAFVLIVVLFILLIIVGATFMNKPC